MFNSNLYPAQSYVGIRITLPQYLKVRALVQWPPLITMLLEDTLLNL